VRARTGLWIRSLICSIPWVRVKSSSTFPIIYTSALEGIAGLEHEAMAEDMKPLFETILEQVPAPDVDIDGPLQLQISALDYNSYVGVIGVGRISRGALRPNTQVAVIDREGGKRNGRVLQVMGYLGLERVDTKEATPAISSASPVSRSCTSPTRSATPPRPEACRRSASTSRR
jgi:predicted membrane GTPase involved in stress response